MNKHQLSARVCRHLGGVLECIAICIRLRSLQLLYLKVCVAKAHHLFWGHARHAVAWERILRVHAVREGLVFCCWIDLHAYRTAGSRSITGSPQ